MATKYIVNNVTGQTIIKKFIKTNKNGNKIYCK